MGLSRWVVIGAGLSLVLWGCSSEGGSRGGPGDPGKEGPTGSVVDSDDPMGSDPSGSKPGGGSGSKDDPADPADPGVEEPEIEVEHSESGVGTDHPFTLDNPSDGVALDADGALIISRDFGVGSDFMWVADTSLPGVSKIDLESMLVVARYYAGGSSTSRTTVNVLGEAFVGSRAGGGHGTTAAGRGGITKILPGDCPDLNGDGVVNTSSGPDDVLPWGQDECVAWFTEIPGDVRGLAAQDVSGLKHENVCTGFDSAKGEWEVEPPMDEPDEHYVWIGGTHGSIYKLDADTGDILMTLTSPSAGTPYGLAVSGDGKLWTATQLGFIDTTKCLDQATCEAEPVCLVTCSEADCSNACDDAVKAKFQGMSGYGITVDCKQRVWMTGTMRLDLSLPPSERMRKIPGTGGSSGIAADANGWVWSGSGSAIHRIHQETLDHVSIPAVSKGVAVDAKGRVLGVQLGTTIDLIEPGPGIGDAATTPGVTTLPGSAYAYSDMTGIQTRLATNDPGWYRQRFEGCADGDTHWQSFDWDAELPEGTWAMFNVRTADSKAELEDAPWTTVACDGSKGGKGSSKIDFLDGEVMEVEVRFVASDPTAGDSCAVSDVGGSARILSFGPTRGCEVDPPPEEPPDLD